VFLLFFVRFSERYNVIPIPKTNVMSRSTNRKKGTAVILTSSPYKAELEASKSLTPPKNVYLIIKKKFNMQTQKKKKFL
jgi:hypothetical protein